ncbi:uncharacterized protein HD556DRAFT_1345721 [Suillus plorans]|uniref:VPS28 N-terminal domain-containing protein n=1 Tax=Suillus plorans TaxID=116603 RepID=A0A9P7DPH9_9AGAM|nr:uncharacterized protein HD556DRAFT_1345721 [Suillus plorans]KAG1799896.1 hypothetical protein HD556DRAFT_1345721 [Suillus plorans]
MTMLKLVKDSVPSIEQSMTRYRMDNPAALHRIRVGVPATVEQRTTWRSTLIFRDQGGQHQVLTIGRPQYVIRTGLIYPCRRSITVCISIGERNHAH